ncbi:MAG: hypothetical protein HRU76_12925 [Phycisphaeraceae bacterium]|nr:hypothetical protein [Phycisphaerales bacterium]QOJ18435.1 MAG: hypothetical protein HRU76_12925 [Phycisphaeraceae bacterium]
MKKVLGFAAVAAAFAGVAQADVLWHQAPNTGAAAYVDQEFSDFPTFSTYGVSDVTFGAAATITDVTVYFSVNAGWPGVITQGRLNIFAKTGSLPGGGDDPGTGTVVNVVVTNMGTHMTIKASGLNIGVGAGSYWIGLTPMTTFGTHGQAFNMQATGNVGDPTAFRNPGGGFGLGTAWGTNVLFGGPGSDHAITIEGTAIPAPGALALLGAAGLVARRRRRA